jgi:glucose-6-phosphate isomerase
MDDKMSEAWAAVMAAGRTPRADGSAPDSIRSLFAADPQRFERMSFRADNMLLDISKTAIDGRAMAALLDLAKAAGVEERRDAMANGEHVNVTENRRALHMALRAPVGASRASSGAAVAAEVHSTLGRMHAFTQVVHGGAPVQCRDRLRVRGQRSLKANGGIGERACGVVRNTLFHPAPGNDGGIFLDLPAHSCQTGP